jgi:hypothetical protein
MSEPKLDPGSVEYWRNRCHKVWEQGDLDAYRILELRDALGIVAEFLESAATYQDRPDAMVEFQELAAKVREVLVPPGVKAARATTPATGAENETKTKREQR